MDCPSCSAPAAGPDQRFCATCGTRLAPATDPAPDAAPPGTPPDTPSGTAPGTVAAVQPPPAFGQPPRITGPLFADDVRPPPPPLPPPPPPPPPPPYAPPPPASIQPAFAPAPYDEERRGRRRTSIVLLLAAAVVAALIGAGGVVLLFGGDDDRTSDTATDRGDRDRVATDAAGTPTTVATETTDEAVTDEPATFRCWNGGAPVMRLATCPPPSGADGMAWVFPSSTGGTCTSDAGVQRASEVDCAPVVGGGAVRFHYSEWRTRAALETYYGSNTVAGIASPGGRDDLTAAQVESRDPDVGYKVAIYFSDPAGLWSVTIYAADEAQYQAALAELEVRPFRQLRGKRAG
ncbi:hypothetical protein [Nocardioides pelophilus]|uniref:hypothetical protein n=1 Tax=Nocardioides pelophilus TaxID=2172019 RepID=UPI0015FEEF02|nr:hypothetical protein [Nocardioides pelophilus]